MHSEKSNKLNLLLTLVALLVIIIVGVGLTYSWIEGGATYSLQTMNENDVKTGPLDADLNTSTILLSPGSTTTVQLSPYDKTSGDYQTLFFTPVSSPDGETFFLPNSYNSNGSIRSYRVANTNDIGTKFVNYEFKFKAAEKCYIAFDGTPSITTTNSVPFRFMVKCGDEKHIFSGNPGVPRSSSVVTNLSGGTTTLTTEISSGYENVYTTANRLFEFDKNETGTIEISIWLDSATSTTNNYGSEVKSSIKFIVGTPKIFFNLDAITQDTNGNKTTSDFSGGTITYNSTTYSSTITDASIVEGTSFTAKATAREGYEFKGWYSDAACTKLVMTNETLTRSPDQSGKTYYALFEKLPVSFTTIYVEPRSGFSTYSIWAYREVGTTTYNYSGNTWPGESAAYDSETTYYKYSFNTTDTGEFMVIISNNGSNQYPGQNEDGLIGELGGTYLFTADNDLIEFDPTDMITFNVSALTGGSATVNGGTTAVKLLSGNKVTLNATPSEGYAFVGWYKNSGCTTTIGSTYTKASQEIAINENPGTTVTYYAKFIKTYKVTAKSVTNGETSGTGGDVQVTGGSKGASSEGYVNSGATATFTATAKTNYRFVGWYTAESGGTLKNANATFAVAGFSADVTYYARFEIIKYTASAYAVTDGTTSGTGGSVQVTNGQPGSSSSAENNSGSTVTFTATPATGYNFVGWYTAASGGTLKSSEASYDVTNFTADTSLYARFEAAPMTTTTIYFAPRSGYSTYYAWVWNETTDTNYSGGTWPGAVATYDSYTGLYKYTFETYETGNFNVIVSNNGASQYPSKDGLSAAIGGTYLFSGTTLTSYTPTAAVTITFNASNTNWVGNDGAIMYLKDTSTNVRYMMTRTSSTSNTWTVKVPSFVKNITFERDNPSGGTWNSWDAGNRNAKTIYKTSDSSTGSWQ